MNQNYTKAGLLYAFCAFGLWGLLPVYFKILGQVPAVEILGHRVLWSALLLLIFFAGSGRLRELLAVLKTPADMKVLFLSSLLIGTNWLCFIWGVTNNRILETSLGYFINPLINVVFGFIFFSERLNRAQVVAVGLAVVAVTVQVVSLGKVPWVAFVLAISFGSYGLVRKKLAVNPATGLAVETFFLLPFILVYFFFLVRSDAHSFRLDEPDVSGLLLLAGVATTVPLVLFNMATKALSLTVLGIMQYLTPSMSFTMGVLIYKEPLGEVQMLTFGLIWLGLVIFSVDGFIQQRRHRNDMCEKASVI